MSKLMCHVVAGFPSSDECLTLLKGMQAAGAAALEVQIPFSDPIADGETIMRANDVALEQGMTTSESLGLIERARDEGVTTDFYVMSYLQKIQQFGTYQFCERAKQAGVIGLIIPDLPFDAPDYEDISKQASNHGIMIIPVLSPAMSAVRLEAILATQPTHVYVTSTRGITGNSYQVSDDLKQLVKTIHKIGAVTVFVGFGITSASDVKDVLDFADVAVVGSAVIKQVQKSGVDSALSFIKELIGT